MFSLKLKCKYMQMIRKWLLRFNLFPFVYFSLPFLPLPSPFLLSPYQLLNTVLKGQWDGSAGEGTSRPGDLSLVPLSYIKVKESIYHIVVPWSLKEHHSTCTDIHYVHRCTMISTSPICAQYFFWQRLLEINQKILIKLEIAHLFWLSLNVFQWLSQ